MVRRLQRIVRRALVFRRSAGRLTRLLQLSLQRTDDFPEFLGLSGRLCHPGLEFLDLSQARVQRGLPLSHLLPKPLELSIAPAQRGLEPVPLGRQRTDLRFELGAPLLDRAPFALQDGEAVALLLDLPAPALEPIGQGIENGDQALGVADGVHQDLVVPWPLAQDGLLLLVVWLQPRLRHR